MSFPKFTVPSGGEFLRDALGNPLPDESLLVLTHIERLERENGALKIERNRYKVALQDIADASGEWAGDKAREVLGKEGKP